MAVTFLPSARKDDPAAPTTCRHDHPDFVRVTTERLLRRYKTLLESLAAE